MIPVYRPGLGFSAVCPHPEGSASVWNSLDGSLVCEVNFVERWSVRLPVDNPFALSPSCASDADGNVRALIVRSDDQAYRVTRAGVVKIGPAFGENAVAISTDAGAFVEYVVVDGTSYTRNGVRLPMPFMTSQGFRDVDAGQIRWADDWLWRDVAPGVRLARPVQRGSVIVGQRVDPQKSLLIDGWSGSALFTAFEDAGRCYDPRIAQTASGGVVVCARTEKGAAFLKLPPYPPYVVLTAPVPVPEPEPPDPSPEAPEPEPEEPDMPPPSVTPDQWITAEWPQLEAQFVTSGLPAPNASMVVFMTIRRFGFFPGEVWPFERLMADLVQQGIDNGSIPRGEP